MAEGLALYGGMPYVVCMTTTQLIQGTLNGETIHRCPDCDRWEYGNGKIRHSKRCDFTHLQPVSAKPVLTSGLRAAARRGDLRLRYTDDQIVDAVRTGKISMDDAMNQDF